jgi:hypothetical protein
MGTARRTTTAVSVERDDEGKSLPGTRSADLGDYVGVERTFLFISNLIPR